MSSIKVYRGHVPATPVPKAYAIEENVGSLRNMDLDNFMARYPPVESRNIRSAFDQNAPTGRNLESRESNA